MTWAGRNIKIASTAQHPGSHDHGRKVRCTPRRVMGAQLNQSGKAALQSMRREKRSKKKTVEGAAPIGLRRRIVGDGLAGLWPRIGRLVESGDRIASPNQHPKSMGSLRQHT